MLQKQKKLGKGGRRPITPYDDFMKVIMAPQDFLFKGAWQLSQKIGMQQQFADAVLDSMGVMYLALFKTLYNLEVNGVENVPEGSAIIAPNHSSWLDAQVIAPILPKRAYFLAKKELFDMPVNGTFIEMAGGISIDRDYADTKGLKQMIDLLKSGEQVVIFPEGTIPGEEDLSRDDIDPETGLLPGNEGAIAIALKTGTPVIPMGLINTGKILPPETFPRMEQLPPVKFPQLIVNIGKPMNLKEYYGKRNTPKDVITGLTKDLMKEIGRLAGKDQK